MTVTGAAEPVDYDAPVEQEQRVTPLELFFDLVFVFAITQVTTLMSREPTWVGLGRGMIVLAALWWAWAAYAWLGNTMNVDEGGVRIAMFVAMAAMLITSLAVPKAFGDEALTFAVAYAVARAMHLALYAIGTRNEPDVEAAVLRMTPTSLLSSVFIVIGALLPDPWQAVTWCGALAIDYLGVLIGRGAGWRVSPGHFAERHGLIVIIAIGESIVSIGVGAGDTVLDTAEIVTALLGMTVAAALWWSYFDVVAIVAERKLREASGRERATQARDSFSYLHLPLVAGIILFAFGIKKVLAHPGHHLELIPAVGLCGGVALYLLAHVAIRWRNVRTISHRRLSAAVVLLALIPAATHVSGLVALAAVAAVTCSLIAYEAIRYAERRRAWRAGERPAPPAV